MNCDFEDAELFCAEIWETFQFAKNDLLKDLWVREFVKFPYKAVKCGIEEMSKTIRPKYIPNLETVLGFIRKANIEKTEIVLDTAPSLTKRERKQFSYFLKKLSTNFKKIKNGEMTQREHLIDQAEMFEDFGLTEDSEKIKCLI